MAQTSNRHRVHRPPGEMPFTLAVALQWDEVEVPWTIEVPNIADLYVAALRDELHSNAGFSWTNWNAAAQYAIGAGRVAEALEWAQAAVGAPFMGQENCAGGREHDPNTREFVVDAMRPLGYPSRSRWNKGG